MGANYCMSVCLENCDRVVPLTIEMLPSMSPDATQQFHALPAFVEDQNFDIDQVLNGVDIQVESVEDIDQRQVEAVLSAAPPEWRKFLLTLSDSDVQSCVSVAPGLVFNSEKMPQPSDDESQHQRHASSPAIPLSVQHLQLDNMMIEDDDVLQLNTPPQPSTDDRIPTNTSSPPLQLPAERLPQTSAETTDQTVPFGRRDSMCSMASTCSDVTRRRCLISDAGFTASSSSAPLPTILSVSPAPQPLIHVGRRGRPCLDDVSVTLLHSGYHVHKSRCSLRRI